MKIAINPTQRSEQLAPLSHEHHDGLLFVWQIRQGLGNETAVETLRSYCNWFWKNHIRQHFYQEEKILLPYLDPEDKLANQLKKEHEDIRDLILGIDLEPDRMIIDLLCSFIEHHIIFEEHVLFPHLISILSTEQLNTINWQLNESPLSPGDWKNEFWKKTAN